VIKTRSLESRIISLAHDVRDRSSPAPEAASDDRQRRQMFPGPVRVDLHPLVTCDTVKCQNALAVNVYA